MHRRLSAEEMYPLTAVTLTTLAGFAAVLGGLIVILLGTPSDTLLGHLLSFAAGIMLYISYGDLLPHAIMDMDGAGAVPVDPAAVQPSLLSWAGFTGLLGNILQSEWLSGFTGANTWMFVGMLFFALVVLLVPEIDIGGAEEGAHGHSHGAPITPAGSKSANGKPSADPTAEAARANHRLLMTGVVAALGISLHNLPEGLIVYNQTITGICTDMTGAASGLPLLTSRPDTIWSSPLWPDWSRATIDSWTGFEPRSCMSRGLAVTFAIFLHNIPEGMAVASPIFASTGSRWQAMKWCIVSSVCEPFAAIVFGLSFSQYLTPYFISVLNASVAGIMICLCLIELIPAACQHISPRAAALSNIAGQVVMFLSLQAMREQGVH